jgi:hypothetical protein
MSGRSFLFAEGFDSAIQDSLECFEYSIESGYLVLSSFGIDLAFLKEIC